MVPYYIKAIIGILIEQWIPLCVLLVVIFFSGIGIKYGLNLKKRILNSVLWPTTIGHITKSEIKSNTQPISNSLSQQTCYSPDIEFTYTVAGKEFVSNSIRKGARVEVNNISIAKSELEKYPQGKEIIVHYNPQNNADCIVEVKYDFAERVPILGSFLFLLLASNIIFTVIVPTELKPLPTVFTFFIIFIFLAKSYISNQIQDSNLIAIPAKVSNPTISQLDASDSNKILSFIVSADLTYAIDGNTFNVNQSLKEFNSLSNARKLQEKLEKDRTMFVKISVKDHNIIPGYKRKPVNLLPYWKSISIILVITVFFAYLITDLLTRPIRDEADVKQSFHIGKENIH